MVSLDNGVIPNECEARVGNYHCPIIEHLDQLKSSTWHDDYIHTDFNQIDQIVIPEEAFKNLSNTQILDNWNFRPKEEGFSPTPEVGNFQFSPTHPCGNIIPLYINKTAGTIGRVTAVVLDFWDVRFLP